MIIIIIPQALRVLRVATNIVLHSNTLHTLYSHNSYSPPQSTNWKLHCWIIEHFYSICLEEPGIQKHPVWEMMRILLMCRMCMHTFIIIIIIIMVVHSDATSYIPYGSSCRAFWQCAVCRTLFTCWKSSKCNKTENLSLRRNPLKLCVWLISYYVYIWVCVCVCSNVRGVYMHILHIINVTFISFSVNKHP